MPHRFRPALLQIALAGGALAAVALAPPSRGPMLLLPIGTDRPQAIRVAVAHGARLLGLAAGGTVLVWADADEVAPLVSAGVIPLAAPFSGCGAVPS